MKLFPLLVRAAIGAPFVFLGYDAIREPGPRLSMATDFGVPDRFADPAVRANGAAMVLGGLSVIAGVLPRAGAAAVVGSMIPTTLAGHSFWKDTDPGRRKGNVVQLLKNVGMVGGLLSVVHRPPAVQVPPAPAERRGRR